MLEAKRTIHLLHLIQYPHNQLHCKKAFVILTIEFVTRVATVD